jgi:hypothetical protein
MNAAIPISPPFPISIVTAFPWCFTRKVLSTTSWLLLLTSITSAAPRPSVIQGIRTISSANVTRVVISLSGPTAYQLVAESPPTGSSAPSRLHVRFSPAGLAPGVHTTAKVDDGLLKEVRTGLIDDSVIRVSLEVEQLVTYQATMFRAPDQLVIQLRKQRDTRAPVPPPTRPLPSSSSLKVPADRQVSVAQPLAVPLPPSSPKLSEKTQPQVIASPSTTLRINSAKQSLPSAGIASSLAAPRNE